MKRFLPIVALILLGAFSYFSFTVVTHSEISDLKKQNADLLTNLTTVKETYAKDIEAQKADRQKIHDALVITLPSQKEGIDNAFNPPAKPAAK